MKRFFNFFSRYKKPILEQQLLLRCSRGESFDIRQLDFTEFEIRKNDCNALSIIFSSDKWVYTAEQLNYLLQHSNVNAKSFESEQTILMKAFINNLSLTAEQWNYLIENSFVDNIALSAVNNECKSALYYCLAFPNNSCPEQSIQLLIDKSINRKVSIISIVVQLQLLQSIGKLEHVLEKVKDLQWVVQEMGENVIAASIQDTSIQDKLKQLLKVQQEKEWLTNVLPANDIKKAINKL